MQHYTKTTVSATEWCGKCRALTVHKVMGGRLGPCEECLALLERQKAQREQAPVADLPAVQTELF